MSHNIGIDIGSTSAKVAVLNSERQIVYTDIRPTGWNSAETAEDILRTLTDKGLVPDGSPIVATGYGRVSVRYADKAVTEITCHGKGAAYLFGAQDCTVLDIGGQDTKIIRLDGGKVKDFIMNDKCSAGTGRFLEIMANTLGVTLNELFALANQGKHVTITSMCTVFAESEVISLIGQGTPKADIACGVVDSIVTKVHSQYSQCAKQSDPSQAAYLTGGLCEVEYVLDQLSRKAQRPILSCPLGRYAGAIGAALCAADLGGCRR